MFAGAAVLIKWLIGLLVYSSWGIISLYYIIKKKNYSLFLNLIFSFIICLLIFIPWQIFTYYKFPTEFLFELGFNQKHLVEVVEGNGGGYFFYIKSLRHYYGYFIPFFFCSTPSITFLTNYIEDSTILNSQNTYDVKCSIMNQLGVDLIKQPIKYTGFEKIKELFDDVRVPAYLKIKYKNHDSRRPFDLLYRHSLYDHITLYNATTEVIT